MTIIHHNSSDSESESIKHFASDIVKKFHRQKTNIFKKIKNLQSDIKLLCFLINLNVSQERLEHFIQIVFIFSLFEKKFALNMDRFW